MSQTTLFWDLDGTITDPRFGIIDSYKEYFKEIGRPVERDEDLLWVIGPPLRECFSTLLQTNDSTVIEAAVVRYRYWYVDRGYMYRDTPYPGIQELLKQLKQSGVNMYVATAKAHTYGKQILDHWSLAQYFEAVHGSELDGTRSNKTHLLKWMLELYPHLDPARILMIGDRKHDMTAAQNNHIKCIAVGYGYGSQDELSKCNPDYFVESVATLSSLLLKNNLK
jgi:phosphoglycolate phosphatase